MISTELGLINNILIKPSDDGKHVESILSDLPLIIMSDAERMFLKRPYK